MDNHYSLNEVCVIASHLEGLSRNPDNPVHIDGDVWVGEDVIEMDGDEACRIVVETVLAHPLVTERSNYGEECFNAIRWLVDQVSIDVDTVPTEHRAAIYAAQMMNTLDDIGNID